MECKYCGREFTAKKMDAMYCSHRCRDNASKVRRGIRPVEEHIRKCAHCGKEFKTVYTVKMYCSKKCVYASRDRKRHERSWDEYIWQRRAEAEQNRLTKAMEKKFYKKAHTVERECAICGSLFYCLDTEKNRTCSSECSRKYRNIKRDKRIPRDQVVDKDINLDRLIQRDNGICWLCGGPVDKTDWVETPTGNKYPGDKYPEVEHVIPVSKGGLHSWDNVRLAHRKCNHEKGADLVGFVPLSHEYAYRMKAKGNPAKQTAQMDLKGNVIKIWNSTGQIRRELGLNDKRIQNVCRGEGKTAFGFMWKYV